MTRRPVSVADSYRRSIVSGQPYRRVAGATPVSVPPPEDHPWWYTDNPSGFMFEAGRSSAGMPVTRDSALTVSAVFRAVVLLSSSVAQLPLHHYREAEDGSKERIRDSALSRRLASSPNAWQSAYTWRELVMMQVLLGGNSYSRIMGGAEGPLSELVPLDPLRVRVEQLENRRLRYTHRTRDGKLETFGQDEILHLRGPSLDGICGLSPITLARTSIGSAMATDEMAARQFSDAPKLAGVFTQDDTVEAEQAEEFAEGFRAKHSGPGGWYGTPILPTGFSFQQLGMSNADAQFLESRKFTVTEVARWFGVPPHMLAELDRATFSNIEEQGRSYVTFSLVSWLRRIEDEIERTLVTAEDEYVRHIVDGLERGKSESRWKNYSVALDRGVMSVNEVRRLENLNPVPGGDEYVRAGNIGGGPAPMEEPDPDPAEEPASTRDDDAPDARLNGHNRLNGALHA